MIIWQWRVLKIDLLIIWRLWTFEFFVLSFFIIFVDRFHGFVVKHRLLLFVDETQPLLVLDNFEQFSQISIDHAVKIELQNGVGEQDPLVFKSWMLVKVKFVIVSAPWLALGPRFETCDSSLGWAQFAHVFWMSCLEAHSTLIVDIWATKSIMVRVCGHAYMAGEMLFNLNEAMNILVPTFQALSTFYTFVFFLFAIKYYRLCSCSKLWRKKLIKLTSSIISIIFIHGLSSAFMSILHLSFILILPSLFLHLLLLLIWNIIKPILSLLLAHLFHPTPSLVLESLLNIHHGICNPRKSCDRVFW